MSFLKTAHKTLVRCPLWSLLIGVLVGTIFSNHYGLSWWWFTLSVGLIIGIIFRKTTLSLLLTGLILANSFHGASIENQAAWVDSLDPQLQTRHAYLEGTITDTGSKGSGPYLMKVTSSYDDLELPIGIHIQLFTPYLPETDSKLHYGDIITVEGNLFPIHELRNPHGFDQKRWLHRQGVNLAIRSQHRPTVSGISITRRPIRIMSQWRLYLREQMTLGLREDSQEAQLIRAVVLGEKPPRPSSMLDDFRHSGTLHVFAVSGLHVGMVGTIIGLALWCFRVPRWMTILLTITGMAAYAGITGLQPPSVRSVIMATVFLSGFLLQRRPTLINSLAASAILVLLWDGHQLFTPGFQLSYGVLLSLALLSNIWLRLLKPMAEIDSFMPHSLLTPWQERRLLMRKWFKNSLSISLAAWMGSAPLMWIHFGIITPIAIIAGIPLMATVFLILAIAMLSMFAGALWQPAGTALNRANAFIAQGTHHIAGFFAHIPGGHAYRNYQTDESQRIIVFDIPYGGGANFIDLGGGILLDSGKQSHFRQHVLPTLTALRASPDSLIISHAEEAHSGGMNQALDTFQPKQALIPKANLRSSSYRRFLDNSAESGSSLIIPNTNQIFQIQDNAWLEVLHAPTELDGYGLADDSGLVIRLHWDGWRILFMGDAGFITETRLLESGTDLTADVIIMGRNSADYSGTESFIQAVSPKAIISTNASFPTHENIPPPWRKKIEQSGIALLDQNLTGAVTIILENGNLTLNPTLSGARTVTLQP